MGAKRQRVVVAGMGDTGVLVAVQLAGRHDVVGVSTRPALLSGQELGNRLADPDHWRRNFFVPYGRFRRLAGVPVHHGQIRSVDLATKKVHVDLAGGGERHVPYDVLVIATGASNGFWRHDRIQDLDAVDVELRDTARRLADAATVVVVGGGATGVSAAASLAHRHPQQAVHLYFGGEEPLPGYHPRARRRIVQELRSAGVHLHPGHRAELPDGRTPDHLTAGPVRWSTGQQPTDADVVLWATGGTRPHTGFLPDDVLDADGFVLVDEHLRVPGHPDVFAVGDVAASDPNRSSARNWGYLVVARNVRALAAGRPERMRRYKAPEHRWGSILGLQDDGMLVFQPDGRAFRVPRRLAGPLLFDVWLRTVLYRGLRKDR